MATRSIPYRQRRASRWHTEQTEDYRLDDVQRLMLGRVMEAFAVLWPSDRLAPYALQVVHTAVLELLEYTVRTEEGRARKRAQMLQRWGTQITDPVCGPRGQRSEPDLAKNMTAVEVVPGLLALLQGRTSDLPGGLADAVDAWLSSSE